MFNYSQIISSRKRILLIILFVLAAIGLAVFAYIRPAKHSPAVARVRQDIPRFAVYPYLDPMTQALQPTGPDLRWTSVKELPSPRLFVSDHPEVVHFELPEGLLWTDEVTKDAGIDYQSFISHINQTDKSIVIGVVVENYSTSNSLRVTGSQVSYLSVFPGFAKGWEALLEDSRYLGKHNAYGDLSGKLMAPLPAIILPPTTPGQRSVQTLISWQLGAQDVIGAHVRLTIRRANGSGPVHCRYSTAWAWQPEKLTAALPLIPLDGPHARGTWRTSEVQIDNAGDPVDLAKPDKDGKLVRCIRLSQPDYPNGRKVYRPDVVYKKEQSLNPAQTNGDHGMYGARIHALLHVRNSGNKDEAVQLFLRYPDKRLNGCYVGAATTFARDDRGHWHPAQTRAVELNRLFMHELNKQVAQSEIERGWWLFTRCIATYRVKHGEELAIPLTFMHDFPAMLPLGITMRKVNRIAPVPSRT